MARTARTPSSLVLAALALLVAAPSAALAQDGPYGTIVRADGVGEAYALTQEDALWAARMLVGEAGGRDDPDSLAVLWSMLNSYTLRPVRKHYPTFAAFVRGYCTPLQPHLKAKGAIRRHQKRGTPMVEVEPGKWQLKRHVELQERDWTALPASARAVVERVFRGEQATPCSNATQFCSTAVYFRDRHDRSPNAEEHAAFTEEFAKGKRWRWARVEGASPKNNCFFVEERFANLPDGVVQIQPPRRERRERRERRRR